MHTVQNWDKYFYPLALLLCENIVAYLNFKMYIVLLKQCPTRISVGVDNIKCDIEIFGETHGHETFLAKHKATIEN